MLKKKTQTSPFVIVFIFFIIFIVKFDHETVKVAFRGILGGLIGWMDGWMEAGRKGELCTDGI